MIFFGALPTFVLLISSIAVTQVSARPCSDPQPTPSSSSHTAPIATSSPVAVSTSTVPEACTQARLDILVSLTVSEDATNKINSTDMNTRTAINAAQEGFKLVQLGIASIATSILTNQSASAESRSQVGSGISQVKTAFARINGTDAADPNLALANMTIDLAVDATNRVVEKCK